MEKRILRLDEVERVTGLRKSAIYKMMRSGAFPKPLKLTQKAVGWRIADVESWIESRPETELSAA